MKYPVRRLSSARVVALAIILLASVAASIAVSVQVLSAEITAYDVFSSNQGTAVALGSEVIYLNSSRLLVIKFKDGNVRVFSAVVSSSGSEIFLAGSYGKHPLLGVIRLDEEVRLAVYVADLINGSFFKLRIIDECLYCAGYVFTGQVYRGLIVVLNESELVGNKSIISTVASVISCKSSCYIRDITELPSNEVMALGAYYSLALYPKYQLMLLVLDRELSTCRGYVVESENSLVPKGVFAVGGNGIVCVAVSENAVCYIELSPASISGEGRAKINIFSLKSSLLSIMAVGSNSSIYILARTSGSQYILGISPSSPAVELTEVENTNPVAVLLRNGEPILLTGNLSGYRIESISGITRIVTPTDTEYSKLNEVQVEIKVKEVILKRVENGEVIARAISVAPTAVEGSRQGGESPTLPALTEPTRSSGASVSAGEEFRKDVGATARSNNYILALSLALISAYLVLRSKLSRART